MSCRLPQAPNPAAFWRLLRDGQNAVTQTPDLRRKTTRERAGLEQATAGYGAFLDDIASFDPAFFGLSPREAITMDPQQRLMLELSWEALEDAGIVPATLQDTQTGVFVGSIWDDYATLLHKHGHEAITQHTMSGLHRSIIANRVSYTLGLHGPSLTVDTAQSSSLVAVHAACESLRSGESALALAGGVNLAIVSESDLTTARFDGLSPDGRCFTFDARANGYVRGEGGATVVLKPLSKAIADGDRIYCVIKGSAVNNDGATAGLTVPSSLAQERVLRLAYENANIAPAAVQYVELHGTETKISDPIVARALGAALGACRTAQTPLLVGSANTNMGHLESAAGIVGLLKTALSITHGEIPASVNFHTANPAIPLAELRLEVNTARRPWPHVDRPLVAGVSSFGTDSTSCHLVLSQAPESETTQPVPLGSPASDSPVVAWPVSGRTELALSDQARQLSSYVGSRPELRVADIGYSLATTRSAFEHRAIVLAKDRESLLAGLDALANNAPSPKLTRGIARAEDGVVFVFPGQGSQWPGMGLELLDSYPVFAERVRECADALAPFIEWSLIDVLRGAAGAPALVIADVVQPALWAMMVAQAELWRSFGVAPAAVVGHSMGEIAAGCVTGALSLGDGARAIALWSQAQATLAGRGDMASIPLPLQHIEPRIARWGTALSIAAVNGPRWVTVSGDSTAVEELLTQLRAEGVAARKIPVGLAAHSAHIDTIRDRLLSDLTPVAPRSSQVPFFSTVLGQWIDTAVLDAEYWATNLRQTVRFDTAIRAAIDQGRGTFLEISPHPVLTVAVENIIDDTSSDAVVIESLRRDHGDPTQVQTSLAALHVHGTDLDWTALFAGHRARRIPLPTYPFQRSHCGPRAAVPSADTNTGDVPPAWQELRDLPRTELNRVLLETVRTQTASVLELGAADSVDVRAAFTTLGVTSLLGVELRNRLHATTGVRLPATVVYDHPTLNAVADRLRSEILSVPDETPALTDAVVSVDIDPVAIVAMACRYPGGVTSPEQLWQLVTDGGDAVTAFPTDRGWDIEGLYSPDPDCLGTYYQSKAGFVDDITGFDPGFFGISPREATVMDPQQRLLLELAWEAFERVGNDPTSLRDQRVGVYIGAMTMDYGPPLQHAPAELAGYAFTGNTGSVAAGRIAYTFGLQGPTMTVDTACSSSLVALHLACQSLRSGESDLALAGGVTVMPTPAMLIEFSRIKGMAPDGRCKAFSAQANGFGLAEGAGILLLERLSDAHRNGHPVLAVVRGSAVNSDGASNGLTAPNGPSQERVIRQALANAYLSASDVDVVEAHGTGTTLGDPIEANALLATYGQNRPADRPVYLGSVKSNIGHTQAAAGVASVIKMVQAMRHGTLPKTLHVDEPTPHVDWSSGAVQLLTEPVPWPDTDRPRRAGVSSFGISGTNAHLILEQAPATEPVEPRPDRALQGAVPWLLSAKSDDALRVQAQRLLRYLADHPDTDPVAVGSTLATARAHFDHRAAILGHHHDQFRQGLQAIAEDRPATNVAHGTRPANPGKTVFVFPGQGTQYPGMGRELFDTEPVFADRVLTCAQAFAPFLDWSLPATLRGTDQAAPLERIDVVQPALFTIMVSLAALWRSYGVEPDAVVGTSQGEIAAAYIAGALSLDDAARIVALRSKLLYERFTGWGALAALFLPVEDAEARLTRWQGRLAVAGITAPTLVTVSGDATALDELIAQCTSDGIRARRIAATVATHCARVDDYQQELREILHPIPPSPLTIPFYSTVTGHRIDTDLDRDYWYANIRQPVLFEQATRTLLATGHHTFIEIGPHPVQALAIEETAEHTNTPATVIATLRRDHDSTCALRTELARAHAHGLPITWNTLFQGQNPQRVDLPTYPFEHQ
ncbi:type I polyketide synthase, partial [Streptomyces spectabilis]|uniref:type I polyketide synthase n=3 Tax=Streptomyces spectabilis TaxID=68270 RepID=UPI003F4D6FC6